MQSCLNPLRIFFLINLFLASVMASGQEQKYISCRVFSSADHQPVPFATVRLKINQVGVFVNAEGDFRLIQNERFRGDSLIVTCIGYKRTALLFDNLSGSSTNSIFIKPATYNLKEVKIVASRKKLSGLDLVSKAIKKIRENYPQDPFNYIAYYRDYQKRDGKYQNLNEAIVQVNDKGFKNPSITNDYRLMDFRQNGSFPLVELSPYYTTPGATTDRHQKYIPGATLGDQYGNELFVLMKHDAIRNYRVKSFSFIDVFSNDFTRYHYFDDPEPVYDNNLLLYKIFFTANSYITGDSILALGNIYIQPRDFSIHRLEYTCYYLTGKTSKREMFSIKTEYGYEGADTRKMYLKYISFSNYFRVSDPSDSSFFRVKESYLLPPEINNSTIVIVMNNRIKQSSGLNRKNYLITLDDKAVKINKVEIKGNRIILTLKLGNLNSFADRLKVTVKDITDIDGRVIDERKTIELNQFRELFVQGYNQDITFTDSSFMDYLPVGKNKVSVTPSTEKYWMNSPESINNR